MGPRRDRDGADCIEGVLLPIVALAPIDAAVVRDFDAVDRDVHAGSRPRWPPRRTEATIGLDEEMKGPRPLDFDGGGKKSSGRRQSHVGPQRYVRRAWCRCTAFSRMERKRRKTQEECLPHFYPPITRE